MSNISFHFHANGFYGIIGRVGSGKSSLLSAILEEIPFCKGEVAFSGTVAYVSQEPIIFSATFQENILFGRRYSQHKYRKVLDVCCLKEDIEEWNEKDDTKVG